MIVVKTEIWPFGHKKGKQELGCLFIINDKTSESSECANYTAHYMGPAQEGKNRDSDYNRKVLLSGAVFNHSRPSGFYPLVAKAILDLEKQEMKRFLIEKLQTDMRAVGVNKNWEQYELIEELQKDSPIGNLFLLDYIKTIEHDKGELNVFNSQKASFWKRR